MPETYNSPDLNSILKTLSAFSNQAITQPPATHEENNDTYEPPDAFPPQQSPHYPQYRPISHPHQYHAGQSHSQSEPQAKATDKDTTPPSSITTWPAALKQVMRTVATNEEIQRRIRFLIQRQHDHEKQWWRGREALLQKQRSRKEKKKELDEVLRSVGAPVDEKDVSTAEEDLAEIQNYDAKVYKASKQMADAMLAELGALNVPFFCLRQDFISDEGTRDQQTMWGKQNCIPKGDLSALQRRMLELLQDLCRE